MHTEHHHPVSIDVVFVMRADDQNSQVASLGRRERRERKRDNAKEILELNNDKKRRKEIHTHIQSNRDIKRTKERERERECVCVCERERERAP